MFNYFYERIHKNVLNKHQQTHKLCVQFVTLFLLAKASAAVFPRDRTECENFTQRCKKGQEQERLDLKDYSVMPDKRQI